MRRLTATLASLPLHPFLFAVLPVLNLYHDNIGLVRLRLLWRPLAFTLSFAALLFFLSQRLFRKCVKSALLVSALLGFIFYVGATALLLDRLVHIPFLPFIACWSAFFLGLCLFIGFAKKEWRQANLFLNVVTSVWTVWLLAAIVGFEWRLQALPQERFPGELRSLVTVAPAARRPLPDIYYIVLDGYGRDDVLRDIYALDNGYFLLFLRSRGFHVSTEAAANYSQTLPSLASSLNMRYLDSLLQAMGTASANRRPLMRLIGSSDLVGFLRRQGYTIVAFDSLYTSVAIADADLTKAAPFSLNDFEITLLNGSLLRPQAGRRGYSDHVRTTLYAFAELAGLGDAPSPKFVFAHLMCPHPPFVFSGAGTVAIPDRPFFYNDGSHFVSSWPSYLEYLRGYRQQVLFVNRQLASLVDAILKRSPVDPVIVLQGDHGPGARLKHEDVGQTDLRERLAILNAMRIPAARADVLSGVNSPVNTFRVVLNSYFAANLPLQADRSFFLTWSRPYLPFAVDASAVARRAQPR